MASPEDGKAAAGKAATELHAAAELERLEAAAAVAEAETAEPERRVLVAAREHLDMDIAYYSHLADVAQVVKPRPR